MVRVSSLRLDVAIDDPPTKKVPANVVGARGIVKLDANGMAEVEREPPLLVHAD